MSDLISRADAIDEWKNDFKEYINALDIPKDDYKGIMEYIDELPPAQPEQRWISCSERLPDDTTYENHLVVVYCTKSGTVDVGWYEAFFKKWWRLEPDEEIREEVIAWMPLPDAYEVE